MYCGNTEFAQCMSKRVYTCSGKHTENVKLIPKGSVLFMYNSEDKTLVGPFTAASAGAERIETGAWTSEIDTHSQLGSVRVEWEDLHILQNAAERFPFLEDRDKCELSTLWTQSVLDALKEAPAYKG